MSGSLISSTWILSVIEMDLHGSFWFWKVKLGSVFQAVVTVQR